MSRSGCGASMSMIECREENGKTRLARRPLEMIEKERQISVDPISVNMQSPVAAHGKLASYSLPNSPRFELTSAKHKKKYKNQQSMVSPLSRQQSVALGNLERLRMQRSKSCGEGRASQPSMDLDLWPSSHRREGERERENENEEGKSRGGGGGNKGVDKFKCGACLFLPGLGKGKSLRKEVMEEHAYANANENADADADVVVVSQRVSLEKFECGSWRSSSIINNNQDDAATSNLFFDLPLELMRCASMNDTESPVTTGFVFDSNRKGVLKVRQSHETCNSSRHVRFSTSSPTSPRQRKARDDFNAFLEAQS